MSSKLLTIVYKGSAFGAHTMDEFQVKKHEDIIVDGLGYAKVYDIRLVEDLLPVVPEDRCVGSLIYVDPSKVLPRGVVSDYEVDRMIRMSANKRTLEDLGLGDSSAPTTPKKPATRSKADPPPPPDRATRHATRRQSMASATAAAAPKAKRHKKAEPAEPAEPADESADEPDPADSADPAAASDAGADAENDTGSFAGSDTDEAPRSPTPAADDKGMEACFTAMAAKMERKFEHKIEEFKVDIVKELRFELGAGNRAGKQPMKKKRVKTPTKEVRRTKGFDWDMFKDPLKAVNLDPDFVQGKMQPFIENMVEPHRELLLSKLAPKVLQLSECDIMNFVFQGIESKEPPYQRLVELVDGARYVAFRGSGNAIQRDLKNRFFSRDVTKKWKEAVTNDAIAMGSLHNTSTLFGGESVIYAAYGVSNRLRDDSAEFSIPALGQHVAAWSKEMEVINTSTGDRSMKMYVGSPILTDFIRAVSPPGGLISLDALAVLVAYSEAKEFGINLNHGFLLGLAAQEWKTWVLKPDTRKTGVIATMVKDYLNKKKAEREAERAARHEHDDA